MKTEKRENMKETRRGLSEPEENKRQDDANCP